MKICQKLSGAAQDFEFFGRRENETDNLRLILLAIANWKISAIFELGVAKQVGMHVFVDRPEVAEISKNFKTCLH